MGGALWVFLWLWREGAAGENPFVREVRGGAPVRVEEIAAGLGLPMRTVKRHLAQLREAGYLTTIREHHAFTAIVNIWRPGGEDQESGAKNGTSLVGPSQVPTMALDPRNDESGAKNGTSLDVSGAKNGTLENPPGPPLKEQEIYLDKPRVTELSSLPDPGFFLRTSSSNKRANIVPIRPGVEGGSAPSGPGIAAAVAAGPSPRRLRHEQAILHHLGRIEAWERPELTATLRDALLAVPLVHLAEVFELCWRKHRLRNKALENPAGWWAAMLRQTAEVVAKAVAQESGFS
jgi:hypothetical protein